MRMGTGLVFIVGLSVEIPGIPFLIIVFFALLFEIAPIGKFVNVKLRLFQCVNHIFGVRRAAGHFYRLPDMRVFLVCLDDAIADENGIIIPWSRLHFLAVKDLDLWKGMARKCRQYKYIDHVGKWGASGAESFIVLA